jgi:hypothetical protein
LAVDFAVDRAGDFRVGLGALLVAFAVADLAPDRGVCLEGARGERVRASSRVTRSRSASTSSLVASPISSICRPTSSLTSRKRLARASEDHSRNPAASPDSCSATA